MKTNKARLGIKMNKNNSNRINPGATHGRGKGKAEKTERKKHIKATPKNNP